MGRTCRWAGEIKKNVHLKKGTALLRGQATTDVLGAKLLADSKAGITWAAVEAAVPPIRTASANGPGCRTNCKGVRTFLSSRGSSSDTTMDNNGEDCNWGGWPHWQSYAINMHNEAVGENWQSYNGSESGDGMVGGVIPTVVFYTPMANNGTSKHRYWTYLAVATPDMKGSREQSILFRFQQIECAGPDKGPPCKLHGWPMYWDSYWYSRFPGANKTDTEKQTLVTGPVNATSSSLFYATLLESRRWWADELAGEGMMSLTSLPSPATTNGTWLRNQAVHSIVRSMITRQNTWEPRYGVCPGYGSSSYHGLQVCSRKRAVMFFGWVFFLISSGSPHVRPMGVRAESQTKSN